MLAVFRGLRADLSNTVGRLLREAFPPAPHFSLAGVYGNLSLSVSLSVSLSHFLCV